MNKITAFEHIYQYNNLLGQETLHPLVNVINLSTAPRIHHARNTFGFYTLFLKETRCGELIYGRGHYDYQEGTIVALAPGQVIGVEDNGETFQPRGWALVFHPDLLHNTSLGRHIREYNFFSYEVNEALHLSEKEREVILECLHNISNELHHAIDKHSQRLIVSNIELLLNYCNRFYERQFITRERPNRDILSGFEQLIHTYFESEQPQTLGLPSVRWCAQELHLSPNYFGDLVKRETGTSAQEYIQQKVMELAKERICNPTKSISEVAYELGFKYPQHFSRLFKRCVGVTPYQYRSES